MSNVDEELTRRLRSGESPVEVDWLFDELERRRARHKTRRRIQVGLLSFVVIGATIAGFIALRSSFGSAPSGPASTGDKNDRLVFSRIGDDGHFHLFVARSDGTGVQQLTHGPTDDTDPAVSPDGRWITLVRSQGESSTDVVTISFDDPDAEPVEPRFSSVLPPQTAWSADSSKIVFREIGDDVPEKQRTALLVDPIEGDSHLVYLSAFGGDLADPSWSPGSRIAFAIIGPEDQRDTGWDLATVSEDGVGFRPLLTEPGDQTAPAWSPDGSRIAFLHADAEGQEIRTVAADGSDVRTIAIRTETPFEPDLAWASDGASLLVSDGTWIYRVDSTPGGDPRANFVKVVRGVSPSWQYIPTLPGSTLSTQPDPATSSTVSAGPTSHDIGLELPMCDIEVLEHIDWDGSGIDGTVWTGASVDEDGSCRSATRRPHIVAVDRDGDGVAEPGSTWPLGSCLLCRPFDTVDLNRDGVLELVVLDEASSTPTYSLYEVSVNERSPGVYPIFIEAPGAPSMDLDPGPPVRFIVGGDEGFSGSLACEDGGTGPPILRYTWVNGAVDADTDLNVDVTRLRFGEDGVFHIESVDRFSVPRNPEPTDLISTEPACGVDFSPAA